MFDGLDVTAGVRVFKIDQRVDAVNDGPLSGGLTTVDGSKSKEDGINPKFGLSYKVARDNLIFASAAKGFRSGGRTAIRSTRSCAAMTWRRNWA